MTGPIVGSAGKAINDTSRLDTADNLKEAAAKFEAVFVGMMLKSMRATKLGDDLLSSSAMDKYRDMQDQHLTQSLAASQPLGLGKALGDFLKRGQPTTLPATTLPAAAPELATDAGARP